MMSWLNRATDKNPLKRRKKLNDELHRMKSINLQLLRKLNTCRADVVEECARFCEGYAQLGLANDYEPQTGADGQINLGSVYAAGLRNLIRQ